ncbi:hypothetical protein [Nocardioides sp. KR10-350]|uniref:hypothetical protein n=1 Tax=Nocardioides cheoyonin TaxID=3156615 RepID=UPI0032B41F75
MALTRRTQRFGELAHAVEAELLARDIDLDAEVVDQILRNRVDAVAELMRVTPRTALGYAPEDLPRIIADAVVEASQGLPETMPCGRRRPHLRLVE